MCQPAHTEGGPSPQHQADAERTNHPLHTPASECREVPVYNIYRPMYYISDLQSGGQDTFFGGGFEISFQGDCEKYMQIILWC